MLRGVQECHGWRENQFTSWWCCRGSKLLFCHGSFAAVSRNGAGNGVGSWCGHPSARTSNPKHRTGRSSDFKQCAQHPGHPQHTGTGLQAASGQTSCSPSDTSPRYQHRLPALRAIQPSLQPLRRPFTSLQLSSPQADFPTEPLRRRPRRSLCRGRSRRAGSPPQASHYPVRSGRIRFFDFSDRYDFARCYCCDFYCCRDCDCGYT